MAKQTLPSTWETEIEVAENVVIFRQTRGYSTSTVEFPEVWMDFLLARLSEVRQAASAERIAALLPHREESSE